jgi:hypothetical protein
MTEDYTGILSFIISLSFFLYCISSFFSGYKDPSKYKPISDNFVIGYVQDNKTDNTAVLLNRISALEASISALNKSAKYHQAKPQPQTKPQPKPQLSDSLLDECSIALQSLGYKPSDSKKAAKSFLERNNHVTTTEQFVVEFFKGVK